MKIIKLIPIFLVFILNACNCECSLKDIAIKKGGKIEQGGTDHYIVVQAEAEALIKKIALGINAKDSIKKFSRFVDSTNFVVLYDEKLSEEYNAKKLIYCEFINQKCEAEKKNNTARVAVLETRCDSILLAMLSDLDKKVVKENEIVNDDTGGVVVPNLELEKKKIFKFTESVWNKSYVNSVIVNNQKITDWEFLNANTLSLKYISSFKTDTMYLVNINNKKSEPILISKKDTIVY